MSSGSSIEVAGLTKKFGKFSALNGLDLEVKPGTIHGFLGPNGAGKSTTIRVLLGLLKANSGTVTILGKDPWADVVELHKRLAYVPGDVALWPTMSGGEAIDLLGNLRGGLNPTRRNELIERFELDPSKRGRQYSKGNRQKVAIVAALASDAELLILDEPTSGLDPLMENVFQEVVKEAKERGATTLLSSHIMSEVETLADHISIIRNGQIIREGTLGELRTGSHTTITCVLAKPIEQSTLQSILGTIDPQGSNGAHNAKPASDQHRVSLSVPTEQAGTVVAQLAPYGLASLSVEPPSLESLFLDLYSEGPER